MMVQNSARTLAIALESLSNVYDELIIVDGGSNDATCDIALSYGANIIHSPWTGNHSEQRNVYLKEVKTDWFFVLDSDEFINIRVLDFLRSLKLANDLSNTDYFAIPRRWLSPFNRNHYIISEPHFSDLQGRLLKYSQNIFYQGEIHEIIDNLHKGEGIKDPDAAIYHLDLLINTEAQRQAKVRKYSQVDPKYGSRHFYLPNKKQLKTKQWNYSELIPSVQILLNNLFDSLIDESEINSIIPAKIKDAVFKQTVPHGTKNSNLTNPVIIPELPVHFFTIVLNGQPFIQYHIEVFKQLPFKWHWHIIEGVAALTYDTAWSLKLGGKITDSIHCNGLSNDGTTEYLDELKQQYPQNVTVYRQPDGGFWHGKREMVNEPLYNINEECLLWQIDVDELWTVEQIIIGQKIFLHNPGKTAAFYWCWYFVGQDLIIGTRNCYAQNPQQDWLRTWRYKPGAVWVAHEPPRLEEPLPYGHWRDIAAINPFLHQETESFGLVFQHFAYVTEEQLRFKEKYYGYSNAVSQWNKLQANIKFPVRLGEYFAWVQDHTQVDLANSWTVVPIAQKNLSSNIWEFLNPDQIQQQTRALKQRNLVIVVDGVFFQLYQTGIARVWKSLLEEWSNNGFARYIVVLDRGKTAPRISGTKFPGVRYRDIERYDYNNIEADREILQQVCDEESANLFISSYYTTPMTTPSVLMIHDMIPELLGWDLEHAMWKGKHHAIQKASAYISVSENTAKDLVELFPDISAELITIAKNGVNHQIFSPASQENINYFRAKYDIRKPYFLLVGAGSGYKNSILFFQAFSQLASSSGFDILITGTGGLLSPELRKYTLGSTVYMLQLTDQELAIAYSGALALVYPSTYEGFGMPIIEAMACGCPVITCPNSALPEAAGEAAIYVNHDDVQGMANAICDVQKPSLRSSLIADGLSQAKKFSWTKMAEIISSALLKATLLPLNLQEINLIIFPDWTQPEEVVSLQIEQVIKAVGNYPKREQTTLLIYVNDIAAEDAELFLSSVMMHLLIEENLDITDEFVISLVVNLANIQLQTLLPKIYARIILEQEDQQVLQQIPLEKIRAYQIDKLVDLD